MRFSEALRLGDRLDVLRRFLLVASPADCSETARVVHVVLLFAQGEGRAVFEDEKAEDQACAAVGAVTATKSNAIDVVLHAARLARGVTLLTEGTAYDVTTQAYLNPSDWTDRPLVQFSVKDHVTVVHSDDAERRQDWFYTRGLSKFGLDDIEVFQPVGLPSHTIIENLLGIAEELLRLGQSPTVGSTMLLSHIALSIRVVRHRTYPSADTPLILREIMW